MPNELNVDELVEAASSPETFDVLAFVRGNNLPTDTVTLYTDADAALKLARIFALEAERRADNYSLADEPVASEEEITSLHERLSESALKVTLRGLAPKAAEALDNHLKATHEYKEGAENASYVEEFNYTLIAKSIVSFETADGHVAAPGWGWEQVKDFSAELYPSEASKLFLGAAQLTYVGAVFDQAISADF